MDTSQLIFKQRPSSVMPEHRPLYKTVQILLVLYFSRGKKSSVLRLNLFNWALKEPTRMSVLLKSVDSGQLLIPTWGFDPALAIALRFAAAQNLVKHISNGFQITEKGSQYLDAILKEEDLFSEERIFLAEVSKEVTEKMVESIADNWA